MRDMARRPNKDRAELFRAAAQAMRVHEAIVEKDFWVCWMLDYLFHDSPWKDRMAFKGGTSLSKAYGAIERFSEDIDLILDWRLLGYSQDQPWEERSPTKQDAFGKEANQRAAWFLERDFAPTLSRDLKDRAGVDIEAIARGQDVLIQYPRAFTLEAIRPEIRLEIGPLAAWVPNEEKKIRPYAAERFPNLFTRPDTTVRTITAERTFWEKATILHQEAHRGPERPLPLRYSRHYYDVYRLTRLPAGIEALKDMDLLQEVVRFKTRFYRCPWARYEDAKPGTLQLLPPRHHVDELRRDYQAMRGMLFGAVPDFDEIMTGIAALEISINSLNAAR
ncbi:MAG: nucleotidyl transferase AbiEii/AbiGii toxin family protein [Acidobacteriota bacterium]|nr:nucleotidyl transferase AbiEii/AbiGii toxin family protein [Acidobacteriota bacterium]